MKAISDHSKRYERIAYQFYVRYSFDQRTTFDQKVITTIETTA